METAALFTFLAGFFAFISASKWWTRDQEQAETRLKRVFHPTEELVQDLLLPLESSGKPERLKKSLLWAGLRRKQDLKKILILKRSCLVPPFLIVALLMFFNFPIQTVFFVGILFFFIFFLIPQVFILHRIIKHRKNIEKNLPDALDLLILCLEAGLSFDAALVRVAEEERRVSTHLSRELTTTHFEIQAGKSREEALKNLMDRCRIDDLTSLLGAILQSLRFGTSLVRTLKVQADAMRKKRRERTRAQILKTPVKLIFPLLLFIFPTLLIVILGPSMVSIFRHLSTTGVAQ